MEIKPDVRTNYYLSGKCPNCGRLRLELYVDGEDDPARAVGIRCEKCCVGWLLDPNGPGAIYHGDLSEDDPLNPVIDPDDEWLEPTDVRKLRDYLRTRHGTDYGAPRGALEAALSTAKAKREALGYGSLEVMAAVIIKTAAEGPPDER